MVLLALNVGEIEKRRVEIEIARKIEIKTIILRVTVCWTLTVGTFLADLEICLTLEIERVELLEIMAI